VPIREMVREDVSLAVESISGEGWGHTRIDLERILALSPDSNLIWESEGVTRGFLTSLVYDRTAAVGHVLVLKESRGRQIGKNLVKALLDRLDSQGVESVMLFATEDGARLYRKFGFEDTHEMLSVGLYVRDRERSLLSQKCTRVSEDDLPCLAEMDAKTYGDDRTGLIRRLYADFPEHCYKLERAGVIVGFVLGRRTPIGFDIGPWICMSGSQKDAASLLSSVIRSFPCGGRVDIGPFSDHPNALRVLSGFHHYKNAERVKLMVRGKPLYQHNRDKVFGVAGFELG
jgi:GNAT superfamily N-acetyltransferase